MKFFSPDSFYRLRREYTAPVIRETWDEEYKKVNVDNFTIKKNNSTINP